MAFYKPHFIAEMDCNSTHKASNYLDYSADFMMFLLKSEHSWSVAREAGAVNIAPQINKP